MNTSTAPNTANPVPRFDISLAVAATWQLLLVQLMRLRASSAWVIVSEHWLPGSTQDTRGYQHYPQRVIVGLPLLIGFHSQQGN